MQKRLKRILNSPLRFVTWLSDSLARKWRSFGQSKKLRKFGQLTSRTVSSVDRAGKGNRRIAKFFAALTKPFATLTDFLDRLGRGNLTKVPTGSAADKKLVERRLKRNLAKAAWRKRVKNSWILRLGAALLMPFTFAWTLFRTRRRALLWWSLPILLVGGVLGFVVYQTAFVNKEQIAARYESAVADAISAGQFEQAELFQRKLEQLGIRTDQGEYRTAFAIGESGDIDTAATRMEAIATPNSPGNPNAHFWLAQHLIDENIERYPKPENFELALAHLNQLKRRVGSLAEIQFLEGIALAKLGRLDESSAAFGESPRRFFEAASAKMQVDMARNSSTDARASALVVQRHLTQMKNEGTPLTDEQFKLDVDSAKLLDNANAAALAVQSWYKSNPNSPEAKLNRATDLVRNADRWSENPKPDEANQTAENLIEAAKLVPVERVELVRRRLNAIAKGRSQPELEAVYQALLTSPETPGMALEFFATDAATKQEWEAADKIFAKAAERSPAWHKTWNNWAYVLDQAFPERREEAVLYAKKATELDPTNADYRETYGTILLNVGRWEEAIEQLEIAVNGLNNTQPVHQALALAYDKTGNSRLANLHRQAAQQ